MAAIVLLAGVATATGIMLWGGKTSGGQKGEYVPAVYRKVGEKLSITDELVENKRRDEDQDFEKHIKILDQKLKEEYPGQQFLVTNFNYDTLAEMEGRGKTVYYHCCQPFFWDGIIYD